MDARLIRFTKAASYATRGIWFFDNDPFCCTLEPPWVNNEVRKSCILPGVYKCERCAVQRYNFLGKEIHDAWELLNVPGRTGILIHTGNIPADTEGCIIVGTKFSPEGVTQSKLAHKHWLEALKNVNEFTLTIEYVPNV